MKILIPVNPDKRKPNTFRPDSLIYNAVPVKICYKSDPEKCWFTVAYWNDKENQWNDSIIIKRSWSINIKNFQIVEWYEEIEIESLYPNEDIAFKAAFTAFGRSYSQQSAHGEGISFLKGYINKQLLK